MAHIAPQRCRCRSLSVFDVPYDIMMATWHMVVWHVWYESAAMRADVRLGSGDGTRPSVGIIR